MPGGLCRGFLRAPRAGRAGQELLQSQAHAGLGARLGSRPGEGEQDSEAAVSARIVGKGKKAVVLPARWGCQGGNTEGEDTEGEDTEGEDTEGELAGAATSLLHPWLRAGVRNERLRGAPRGQLGRGAAWGEAPGASPGAPPAAASARDGLRGAFPIPAGEG